ncbi:MAG: hypothetical protein M1486_02525 [Gammaproteobacteria bacterium]|nr:hypothetical protein [Gammaproteobacteria bacterium]
MMKKIGLQLRLCINICLMCSISLGVFAATKDDDAKQALQQLQLLQRKLSQNPGQDGQGLINSVSGADSGPTNVNPASAANQVTASNNVPQEPSSKGSKAQNSSGGENTVITQDETEIIDNKAFKDMTRSLYPLNPEQIVRLKQIYQTNEYA